MANLVAVAYDDMDPAERPGISKHGGRVIQSSLSDDQEQAFQEALDNRGAVA